MNEVIFDVNLEGSPQHEELYKRLRTIERLRTTVLGFLVDDTENVCLGKDNVCKIKYLECHSD